jgi:putative transposase
MGRRPEGKHPVEPKRSRKKHSPAFKSKVAVEAIRMVKTVPDIAKRYEIHPSQVHTWKKRALEGRSGLWRAWWTSSRKVLVIEVVKARTNSSPICTSRLDVFKWSFNGLKKSLDLPIRQRRLWIEPCDGLSIRRQCELADVNRSGLYYEPVSETV